MEQFAASTRPTSYEIDNAFEQFVASAGLDRELTAEERAMYKEKFIEAQFPAAVAASDKTSGAQSTFKLSQAIPIVVMTGLGRFNIEQLGYRRHVEIGYVVLQLLCFCVLYFIYDRIHNMKEDGITVKVPEETQVTGMVSPAKELTTKEYDTDKLKRTFWQQVVVFIIVGGIYYKWDVFIPIVIQALMTPVQLYESPLTQIHLLGRVQNRPFGSPPPTEEAGAAEEKKDK
eukprot:gnl/TRDRNA2_/TRDRNA2_34949_c0_seq1.p1 gnl/TRDRNA2_/TRDRNA2_34949_c0~~gnl/TRDRNA2_/TRDRNA2_34949_c0_seq1.p1  ORF type:complete len:230 (-),score=45.79 gnl/TRDRNA2_/TRDRNA2_34949_c0_seq1:51-740(-)